MPLPTRKPQRTRNAPVHYGKLDRPAKSQAALKGLLLQEAPPGIFDVGTFCKKYGMKRDHISRMTSYAPRTVAAWATGTPIKGAAIQKITELKRLTSALENLVEPESIGPWFQTRNPSFEGSTPAQLVERGESDRIWRMIHLLESGQPG